MKIINKPIFKVSLKNNWKVFLIHLIVAVSFLVLMRIVSGFLSDALFQGLQGESLGYWVTAQTAGMFSLSGNFSIIMLIFLVIVGGGFINRPAMDGSLSAYLTVPVSRKKYSVTTLVAYYTMIIGLVLTTALVGLLVIFSFPGAKIQWLFIGNYFAVVGIVALVSLTIAAISYFSATLFAGTNVKGMYVLIPIAFFVVSMFAELGSVVRQLKFLRYLSPYSWFDTTGFIIQNNVGNDIVSNGSPMADGLITDNLVAPSYIWWDKNPWLPALFCLAIIAACSVLSVIIYRKKKFAV
ncbi:MAG: ABC transporter permease subunit [Christensenellaceae bacterium]|jgi:ABC-type multidrug transport system permease subunit|nr:ABC transporter permease subunit [Christensenellaceae bacterium]